MKLFLALIFFTQSVYGAAIWPNGNRLETFQNGFLFGNGQTIDSAASGFTFGNGAQYSGPLTLQQQSTPTSPSSGFDRLYFKSDENLYKLDSSSQEVNVSSVVGGGQQQSGASFPELRVPNQQVVRSSASVGLIETGNSNLLLNSGFEHQTYNVGWTTSGTATYSAETSAPLSGLKSFKAVASAQTIDLVQDTTLYAAARAGSQMFYSFEAKNTAAGVTACVRKNGVKQTGSNDCLTLATDGVTRSYELAFLADGTSNGIEIDASSTTGTLIVDEVKISTESAAFVDVAQIGPWIDYGLIPLTAVTSNPTKGTTTADKVECRVSGQDYECRYRFANTGTGAAAGSGDYLVGLPTGVELNESFYVAYTGSLSGTSQDTNSAMETSGGSVQNGTNSGRSQAFYYGSNRFRLFLTAEFASTGAWSSGYKPVTVAQNFFFTVKFRGKGLSNKVSTYSQFAVSDVSVENVFSAKVSATGVVSGENLNWINGNAGVSGTSIYTITLNSGIFTQAPNCVVTAGLTATVLTAQVVSTSSTTVVYQTITTNTTAAFAQNAEIICTKAPPDFKAKNVITGTFQNIEKCADPYECTDTFSAKVSAAGLVSDENIDWINGNCTNATPRVCTFISSLVTTGMNCQVTAVGAGGRISTIITSSSTTFSFQNDPSQYDSHILCQKQGVDFRPKTAVAGTFLDSVTSPGAGKVSLCSAKISSTGVISDQIGGCFASCTNATTPVCTFTSNYWVSGSVPNCWHTSSSGNFMGGIATTTTTFAGLTLSGAGTPQAGSRDYFCTGLRP